MSTETADARTGAHLQIGQVAALTEVSVRTVRHWEEAGLITPSARSAGGFRLYTEDDVGRLRTVRRMKPRGFTLEEMKQLLTSLQARDPPSGCNSRASQQCHLGAAGVRLVNAT